MQGNRRYIKCLYVYNKVDMLSIEEVDEIARRQDSLPVSCSMQLNMDMLLMRMWDMMGLVRVYTKKVRSCFTLLLEKSSMHLTCSFVCDGAWTAVLCQCLPAGSTDSAVRAVN